MRVMDGPYYFLQPDMLYSPKLQNLQSKHQATSSISEVVHTPRIRHSNIRDDRLPQQSKHSLPGATATASATTNTSPSSDLHASGDIPLSRQSSITAGIFGAPAPATGNSPLNLLGRRKLNIAVPTVTQALPNAIEEVAQPLLMSPYPNNTPKANNGDGARGTSRHPVEVDKDKIECVPTIFRNNHSVLPLSQNLGSKILTHSSYVYLGD